MESSWATPCHLDRVDLGAGLSARTAECIKHCTATFKCSPQLLEIIFFYKGSLSHDEALGSLNLNYMKEKR